MPNGLANKKILNKKIKKKPYKVSPVSAPKNTLAGKSHADLDKEFRSVGSIMRARGKLAKKVVVKVLAHQDYTGGQIAEILKDTKILTSKKSFGKKYRVIFPEQDELLSTSSAREIIAGVVEKGAIPKEYKAQFEALFENISRVRFPTKFSGFSLATEIMQHPTAKGTGYFSESSKTASVHSKLDLQRKQEVVQAMTLAASDPKATPESIVKAGMRAAIGFTLNVFTAPITASDVKPYALGISGKTQAELEEQVRAREGLKALLVQFDGKQESDPLETKGARLGRAWGGRKAFRSASPLRI